jgi:F0F1-type ATP synthase membrane subunit c/vacuolar-type H+-ATPase subunit K
MDNFYKDQIEISGRIAWIVLKDASLAILAKGVTWALEKGLHYFSGGPSVHQQLTDTIILLSALGSTIMIIALIFYDLYLFFRELRERIRTQQHEH